MARQLRKEHKLEAVQIERVELKAHPRVPELTGKKSPPQTGLEGKFSVYQAVAAAPSARGSLAIPRFRMRQL